jgi:hypothetical protein
MKLTFVDNLDAVKPGRKAIYPWTEFFEELYKHPNKWAVFPIEIVSAGSAYVASRKYKDITVRVSKNKDTDKWTCYFKFTNNEEVF